MELQLQSSAMDSNIIRYLIFREGISKPIFFAYLNVSRCLIFRLCFINRKTPEILLRINGLYEDINIELEARLLSDLECVVVS